MVVSATDGALSYDGRLADTGVAKLWWIGNWLFMYAGELGNADLLTEAVQCALDSVPELTETAIRESVSTRFRRRFSRWASDPVLSPFDLDIDEFKRNGLAMFGEKVFSELSSQIINNAHEFKDSVLVVGWDPQGCDAAIHEENWAGSHSHSFAGLAAIGSGAQTAISQLLLLGHTSNRRLEDTIYAVAAAKFAAESAEGVGRQTSMVVSWKPQQSDEEHHTYIQLKELTLLRNLWEEYGRPRIPSSCYQELIAVAKESKIPDTARSDGSAISEARWKNTIERVNAPLKPGETKRIISF
jgi:hypothetical protein